MIVSSSYTWVLVWCGVCDLYGEGTFTTRTSRSSVLYAPSHSVSLALWLFIGPHTSTSSEWSRQPIRHRRLLCGTFAADISPWNYLYAWKKN